MNKLKCTTEKAPEHLDAKFWDERWKIKDTGWDMNGISPPLKAYFESLSDKNKSILIPGCGNAYEAEYLLENGFQNITLIDISSTLVQQLLEKFSKYAGKQLTIICGDFFKHTGSYDFIIEQTFFSALEKSRRTAYVNKMYALLKEEGKLAGLLFNKEFDSSPPFGGSKKEYLELFSGHFKIEKMKKCTNSVKPRAGTELSFELTKI